MLNAGHLREMVVRPALQHIVWTNTYGKKCTLWNPSAENWCLGTIFQESSGSHLRQIPQGPARGLYQMEPATHQFLRAWLSHKRNSELKLKVDSLRVKGLDAWDQIPGNLYYATVMARLRIWITDAMWPDNSYDIEALATIWKKYYNTALGKGKVQDWIYNFRRYVTK